MRAIFEFFVANWRFSFILKALILVAGIGGIVILQKESYPPVNFATVSIATIYPGASPEEVEEEVTNEIEDELRGIEGLEDVSSVSQPERSEIIVRIDIDRRDPDSIVNEIQRAVQRASGSLPADLPELPQVTELKAEEIPVIEFALVGENAGRKRDTLAYRLKKDLEDVSGVSNVRLVGYRAREFQILLDQNRMRALDVGLPEVSRAISSRVNNVPGGYLRDDESARLVRVLSPITDAASLGEIPIRSSDAFFSVRINQVGRAVEGSEDPTALTRFNGQPATLLVITKKSDAAALDVVERIQALRPQIEAKLPPGYTLHIYNDEGLRVENRLEIVSNNALGGLAIVILVLFLFLPGRIGLISAFSLPLTIGGTVAFMIIAGASFNIVTMMALIICLGNLVDNSVVMAEHYSHLREQGENAREAAIQSALAFWAPFTASTITIIAAFLPMLVTVGVMGQFIRWIPIVVTGALLISLIEALFLLPARLQMVSPAPARADGKSHSPWFDKFQAAFERLIALSIRRKYRTFAVLSGLVVSGVFVTALFNRFELFPAEGVEYYFARFETPTSTSIYRTDELGAELSARVSAAIGPDKLRGIVSYAGVQQAGPGDPQAKSGEQTGLLTIAIKPEVAPDLDIPATLATLRGIAPPAGISQLTFEAEQGGPPIGKPLTVTLRSPDYGQMRALADAIKAEAARYEGVFNIDDDEERTGPELTLSLYSDRSAIAQLSTEAVGANVRSALQGLTVGKITRDEEEVEIVVKLADADRETARDVMQLEAQNALGQLVPISGIARLAEQEGPAYRKHYNFRRAITVSAEVDPEKITSTALNSRIQDFVAEQAARYPLVTVKFGGEEENTQESLQSLGLALLLAIFGIFATLVFTFQSFSKPVLILSSIPLGLIGVFYAFVLDQRPLSFIAFIGVVGLSGVVINSAIILVDYVEELRRTVGDRMSLDELLVAASGRRLRAVLATGLTTVVGLLPAAFGIGGYDSLLVPMTLALSWGMIVGTVLALLWIPASYLILADLREKLIGILRRARPVLRSAPLVEPSYLRAPEFERETPHSAALDSPPPSFQETPVTPPGKKPRRKKPG